jgi:hypothetical protein
MKLSPPSFQNKPVDVMEIMLAYSERHTDYIKYNMYEKFALLSVDSGSKCARYSNYDVANRLVNTSD